MNTKNEKVAATRESILEAARKCVCGHRTTAYGTPENSFSTIAQLWTAYIRASAPDAAAITATDVAMMMALLKIARIAGGTATEDSFIDLAGYAACGGEISANEHIEIHIPDQMPMDGWEETEKEAEPADPNKKYELTDMTDVLDNGVVIHRIKALRSFGDVHAGQLGGWVESEANLSHEGDCWVTGQAKVFGNARVSGDALVCGWCRVYGKALVTDKATVADDAIVCGNATICGDAIVDRNTLVAGDRVIGEDKETNPDQMTTDNDEPVATPDKKYELTDMTKTILGITVYRIRALRDFGRVKAGDLGGFVETEDNLSHDGDCWVDDDAVVLGRARVCDDAFVYGKALVFNSAMVCNEALVCDNARVAGHAKVLGNAFVSGSACIEGSAQIKDFAKVFWHATVTDNAVVKNFAEVRGYARVFGDASICGYASIADDAEVFDNAVVSGKASVYGSVKVGRDMKINGHDLVNEVKGVYEEEED